MSEPESYRPPYAPTSVIVRLVAEISEKVGRFTALAESRLTPQLRRMNRIRSIQASLEIENSTLSVEQVSAVLDGKQVFGQPREIQEVRNAFSAYEAMEGWNPGARDDLLAAHRFLMAGLVDEAGCFRGKGVGIFHGDKLVHMAPQAERVPYLMDDLLSWLNRTKEHPLVSSSLFHYELEFIHPFADGNGRIGRLWQTLILSNWQPLLAYLPVETIVRDRQEAYYQALAKADQAGEGTPFVEFMLEALLTALEEAVATG